MLADTHLLQPKNVLHHERTRFELINDSNTPSYDLFAFGGNVNSLSTKSRDLHSDGEAYAGRLTHGLFPFPSWLESVRCDVVLAKCDHEKLVVFGYVAINKFDVVRFLAIHHEITTAVSQEEVA